MFPVADSLPHQSSEDIESEGYFFPKGTYFFGKKIKNVFSGYWNFLGALSAVMHDPKNFENPGEFSPRRFLDENGHFSYNDNVCSFSVGRRNCIGKSFDSIRLEIIKHIIWKIYYIFINIIFL